MYVKHVESGFVNVEGREEIDLFFRIFSFLNLPLTVE